jgi:hypothetical protein
VLLDLAFRLNHETQADAVAGAAGQQADAERARVPQRIEPAGVGAEFNQALLRQARWSVSSRAAASNWRFRAGSWVTSAWAL